MNDETCDRFKGLIAGLLDGELTPGEAASVNDHLIRCESCRTEYEEMRAIDDRVGAASFEEPNDRVLRGLWRNPYSGLARTSGLILTIGGYLGLLAFGVYEYVQEEESPSVFAAAIVIGLVLLVGEALINRLRTYGDDPYKEIER